MAPPETIVGRRILVVAPHADDEVIGCGGTIARATDDGADVTLVIMATGGVRHDHLQAAASIEARMEEIAQAAGILGIRSTSVLFPGRDMHLESVTMFELVTALDGVLAGADFDECYFPEPNHNLDHRLTHDAVLGALRQRGRRPLRLVAAYEGTVAAWRSPSGSGGKMYVSIEATLERKVAALRAYASQVRAFPHPTSEEAIRTLAAMRGLECGLSQAERFRIHRLVRK